MGFTKRELAGFLDSLTALVSEENRKEAEFLIQTFMDSFEKSYPYETTSYMEKETVSLACDVAALPESVQQELREEVSACLRENGNYSPESVERAMDSKVCDLEELLDIAKYAGKLEVQNRKTQDRSRGREKMTAADDQIIIPAAISVRIRKPEKHRNLAFFEVDLDKDIKQCMQCRFFYGSSRQCIAKECVKKPRQKETVRNSQCTGCPYKQSESYCFPCMKKILEGKKEEDKKNNDG